MKVKRRWVKSPTNADRLTLVPLTPFDGLVFILSPKLRAKVQRIIYQIITHIDEMNEVKTSRQGDVGLSQSKVSDNLDFAEAKEIKYLNSALAQMKAEFARKYTETPKVLVQRVNVIYKSFYAEERIVSDELIDYTREKLDEQSRVFEAFGPTALIEEFLRLLNNQIKQIVEDYENGFQKESELLLKYMQMKELKAISIELAELMDIVKLPDFIK